MSDDDPYFPKLHQLKGIAVGLNDEMRLLFDAFVSGSASDAHLDRFLDIRKEARDAANEVDNEMQRLEDEYESKTAATSSTRTALFRSKLDEEDLLDGGASQLVRLVQNSIDELERAQTDYFKKLRASRTINPSSAANSQQQTASNIEIQPEASGQQMKVDLSTLTAGTGSLNLVIKYPNQGFRPSTDAIPLFDGNAADFGTFWNLFEPIHLDQSISVQAKFNMLFSKLGPSIKKNFRAYGSTTANYHLIVNELRATYGNPTAAIEELSERLYELPIHDNKRTDDLQTFRTIQSIVNQLEYLGADIDNFMVFKAVSQRIPSRIFDEIIKRRTPRTTKEYMAAATEIFHSLDELERAYSRLTAPRQRHESPRPRFPNHRSITQRCIFCGKHAGNQDCRSVPAMDERRRILQTQRRCFRCLSTDHLSRECQAVCSKCQGHHHAYICSPVPDLQLQQRWPPVIPEQQAHLVSTVITTPQHRVRCATPDNHHEEIIPAKAATMVQNPATQLTNSVIVGTVVMAEEDKTCHNSDSLKTLNAPEVSEDTTVKIDDNVAIDNEDAVALPDATIDETINLPARLPTTVGNDKELNCSQPSTVDEDRQPHPDKQRLIASMGRSVARSQRSFDSLPSEHRSMIMTFRKPHIDLPIVRANDNIPHVLSGWNWKEAPPPDIRWPPEFDRTGPDKATTTSASGLHRRRR